MTEKYTDRQIEIMEAATERIDQYGIQNLTIKNLAADIGLSEPALYRHFESKNKILLGLLNYFKDEIQDRIQNTSITPGNTAGEELQKLFSSHLRTFTERPAIVSVIFAESIFHFDETLSDKVSEIMKMMNAYVKSNIEKGQAAGEYSKMINAATLTTIITGGMRMAVLKWKMTGHRSDLIKDGNAVLEGILKMIKK